MSYTIAEICTKIETNRKKIIERAIKKKILENFKEHLDNIDLKFGNSIIPENKIVVDYKAQIDKEVVEIANYVVDEVVEILKKATKDEILKDIIKEVKEE